MKAKNIITTGGVILGGLIMASGAGALSYVDETNVQFTFNPMLTMTLSEGDLTITDLAPGNSKNSNAVAITVNTNSVYGYGLYATVGNSTYNSTDLVLSGGADSFTSIATNANASSLSGGYWGYSIDAGTTYNGLPLYTATNGAELKTTTGAAQNDATSFLIGAAADTAQTQGTYNNVINFSAVARMYDELSIEAMDTMQNLGSLSTAGKTAVKSKMVAGQPYTLQDSRDGQDYTVAKLADGKVWMTKNLNLAGGTALTSDDTDMPSNYTMPMENGFGSGNTLPASATKNSADNNLTDSTQFSDNTMAYVFNSGTTSDCGARGQNVPCYSYYSWTAATLGSGVGVSDAGTNVTVSICPKGWRLPTATTSGASATTNNNWKTGDNYALATAYGANLESNYYENAATFYNNAGPLTTVPNFLLAGYYYSGTFSSGGTDGFYWSSTVSSATGAYYLYFSTSFVNSASSNSRYGGRSVRCILAD